MRLDGFGIFVERMPAMVRFYRDVLGFEIREDENASNVYLEKDGTLFLLYRRADFEKMTGRIPLSQDPFQPLLALRAGFTVAHHPRTHRCRGTPAVALYLEERQGNQ